MRYLLAIAVAVFVFTGCLPASRSVVCQNGVVCPENSACDDAHGGCVDPDQLAQCSAAADRAACTLPGGMPGTCQQGVCLEASCGNARLDLASDEVCDDGNNIDDDGCSGDCKSDEKCGTGVVDPQNDEVC